jgi:hypothetical protein
MMMAYGKDYEVTYIVSINFRENLDAQNAGNCISGLQISNIFWGSMPPDSPMRGMLATWLSPTNILSHRKVPFQKMLPSPRENP